MEISTDFKIKIRTAVLEARKNFDGSDDAFAKTLGLNGAIYSRLKGGEVDKIISESNWINIAIKYGVTRHENNWKVVRTQVYEQLEDSLTFCKEFSKAMIFSDECDIGKTFSARHIVKGMKNAFYIDCSQYKTRQQFIRALAKIVGLDNTGKYIDVKTRLKWALVNIDKPLIVFDEAGDLEYMAFLEIKEIWNATEGMCGMYMIGADGLQTKLDNGFKKKKVGFAEILSRFSDEIIKVVPTGKENREAFFSKLINDVASANMDDKTKVIPLVRQCVKKEKKLRHLGTLIKLQA
ncbi:ATP-binding protein [Flavobacterium sp. N1994]|uniref:ATP-binding protein n=1 Tax=Flavobacterium sp. N1994 TaxID=2986827 RepID=UPI002221473B|nr:ATP-binding protein [Flavobacterium sp. N1994]